MGASELTKGIGIMLGSSQTGGMDDAAITQERVCGHTLRVASWRLGPAAKRANADRPPVLFLNGIGANIETLEPIGRAMSGRAVIAVEMPGTGRSPDPVWPYNVVSMSWTLARLLRRLEVPAVDLVGLSWGGALAQQFALQHRARVRRLVLAATTPGVTMAPGNFGALSALSDPVRSADPAVMNELFAALYGPAADDWSRADLRRHFARLTPPSPVGFACQAMALAGWTSLPALPFLSTPTLVMTGDEDVIVPPSNARILHSAIPKSRLVTIERAGHLFLLTHMRESLAAISAFLDEPAAAVASYRAAA